MASERAYGGYAMPTPREALPHASRRGTRPDRT
jgi:hypothetical protein